MRQVEEERQACGGERAGSSGWGRGRRYECVEERRRE